jgi:hypothetical protein
MSADVRQSGFALVGDLGRTAVAHLMPLLGPLLELCQANLDPDYVSVCNNACWAVGEIAVRVREGMAPVVAGMLGAVAGLVVRPQLHKSLLENCAITLGRFALVAPEIVAPRSFPPSLSEPLRAPPFLSQIRYRQPAPTARQAPWTSQSSKSSPPPPPLAIPCPRHAASRREPMRRP